MDGVEGGREGGNGVEGGREGMSGWEGGRAESPDGTRSIITRNNLIFTS